MLSLNHYEQRNYVKILNRKNVYKILIETLKNLKLQIISSYTVLNKQSSEYIIFAYRALKKLSYDKVLTWQFKCICDVIVVFQ